MIGRKSDRTTEVEHVAPQGFDAFDLRLGDIMRGERATMGKSLLDVQRELRIKASYIAAIENCDPSAFDTPGFIAGYVRSYARYLGMDPDRAFAHFCAESGFSVAHGMSEKASTIRKPNGALTPARPRARDPLAEPKLPFAAKDDSLFSRIEPGAIGSTLVLVALMAGIGYGGWSVLQEVQRVQVAPVDQTPVVLSELDPLDGAMPQAGDEAAAMGGSGPFSPPSGEAFDRLYRPQALDVPVLVARDAPISTLDPDSVGVFAGMAPRIDQTPFDRSQVADAAPALGPGVTVVAVRPSWVKLDDASGKLFFSGILNAGDTLTVPADAQSPRINVGESAAVYFALDGTPYGPAGARGAVTSDLPLDAETLMARYAPATAGADRDLDTVLAELDIPTSDPVAAAIAAASRVTAPGVPGMPKVLADSAPGVTIVAAREAWVRVKASSGATLFEAIMQAGDTYNVPQTEQPPVIRTGNAGAIYFAVNGQTFGPYGSSGAIADNLALSPEQVMQTLQVADLQRNVALAKIVAELDLSQTGQQ
ncbi:helix-turn-helix domain-containing protein [Thetidibacter halocola]|uniref:DUF4115 domain-containing protein n=1 Tax=Thetidibacter halocola TaxID=2827239 RepID=A0A8J8B825_9RHOB|nr:helix-turn-helix domain-containing protein [Thetidibacter halocola]MBS0122733.1 DUF4115 domain-containing protein [Thetidibacter halocola]